MPEGIFDDSLDLLVWGHEHEERANPEPVRDKNYRICQPGSTVVTALSKGEDKPKLVAVGHSFPLTLTDTPLCSLQMCLHPQSPRKGLRIDQEGAEERTAVCHR